MMYLNLHAGRVLAGVLVMMSALSLRSPTPASAQPMPAPVRIGQCTDHTVGRRYDVDSNLWFRNVQFHGDQFRAMRDPSGMTLMLLPSADPSARYWVTWDLKVIRIQANGVWMPVGACQLAPPFVAGQRPPPVPQSDLYYDDLELHGAARPVPVGIPTGMIDREVEFLPPLVPTATIAQSCLDAASGGSRKDFYDCVASQALGAREQAAYQCVKSAPTREALALCMLRTSVGSNERAALDDLERCAIKHGQDWRQYPVCMADGRVDPEVMRGVSCAQQNIRGGRADYWAMAACFLGPKVLDKLQPNTETAIAMECAMASGGDPATFVGCTGGQLAIIELDKCLARGVGDNGCFGKNNVFTRTYREIGNAIAKNFGDQSVVYDAWKAYESMTNPAEVAKTLNNIARETTTAAQNVAREARKVMPRIKIKRIKIKW